MLISTYPKDPIAAVNHPDPYPFYAKLTAEKPLYFDESLRLWVASSAGTVTAVMTSDLCRVRPTAEPVPHALVGSTAGKIFGALVRMNDGQSHCPLKQAVTSTLDMLDQQHIFEVSLRHARILESANPTDFSFQLPAYVVADLLGVSRDHFADVANWMSQFVRCLSPISTAEQIEQGKQAAEALWSLFEKQFDDARTTTLFPNLKRFLSQVGINNADFAIANAIGFISQAYEATAGLIGNSLIILATHPDLHEQINTDFSLLKGFVAEVARFDAPVQNTRRFLAADSIVAGQAMHAGDSILVVLAAAKRDPAANPQPDRFDLHRAQPACFTFGLGAHACPGQSLALTITHAALQHLLTLGFDPSTLRQLITYRPSANTRIPLFTHP